MTVMLPPLQCKRSSCTLFQQTFCERCSVRLLTSFSLFLVICMCRVLCRLCLNQQHTRDSSHVTIRGPQHGPVAVSALGSGRSCPTAVIAFCPFGCGSAPAPFGGGGGIRWWLSRAFVHKAGAKAHGGGHRNGMEGARGGGASPLRPSGPLRRAGAEACGRPRSPAQPPSSRCTAYAPATACGGLRSVCVARRTVPAQPPGRMGSLSLRLPLPAPPALTACPRDVL